MCYILWTCHTKCKLQGYLIIYRSIAALLTNNTYTSDLPRTTVAALEQIIPNIPQLTVDAVNIIKNNDTDVSIEEKE